MEKIAVEFDPIVESLKEYAREVAYVPTSRQKVKDTTRDVKRPSRAKVKKK